MLKKKLNHKIVFLSFILKLAAEIIEEEEINNVEDSVLAMKEVDYFLFY